MSTRFEWKHGGNHVLLAGAFTAWKAYPMTHVDDSPNWYYNLDLPIGTHHFKFVVDGVWRVDDDQPQSGKKNLISTMLYTLQKVFLERNMEAVVLPSLRLSPFAPELARLRPLKRVQSARERWKRVLL